MKTEDSPLYVIRFHLFISTKMSQLTTSTSGTVTTSTTYGLTCLLFIIKVKPSPRWRSSRCCYTFLQARCSCHLTNSVKALKEKRHSELIIHILRHQQLCQKLALVENVRDLHWTVGILQNPREICGNE